ncbi:helix-turn-helix domain-containing protein [Mycolicibacterium brisbanense]|uniref:Two component GAF domain sensor and regulator n=1 Tax=Mycolicibacterium brisbanense TaxID=146020 RepID=A0A100VVU8_9MYCO|nr:GAF domain-containing protein [Mycolicibacterium brisbanense]GAS86879.1 two component GAF domain sensor and regulator [Mycolicibacterium brisbanense]
MRTYTSGEMRQWLGGVGDLAAAVNAATPLPKLLDLIAETACSLTGYEASGVLLVDDERHRLYISGSFGLSVEYVAEVNERRTITVDSGPLSGGPSTWAFRSGEPAIVRDILADPTFAPWAWLADNYGYRAMAAVPLLVDRAPVGTLNCYRTAVHDFGPDEVALLWTLANQAGTALQSSRLISSLTEQRRLLEQSEDIHRELTEVALRAGGVQGVADALARLQRRPVLVTDNSGAVIANAAYEGVQLAPEPIIPDQLPDGIGEVAYRNRVTAPVSLGRDVVARLWLPTRLADLSELDRRALEHAAVVCALEVLRQRTATDVEWSLRSDLLADFLAGAAVEALATRAGALGHDLTRAHTVIVAASDGDGGPGRSRSLLSTVRAVAAQCEPRPLVSSTGGDVLVLWPDASRSESPGQAAERIRTAVSRLAGAHTATVVVGHRCERLTDARAAMGTARAALELARLHGTNRVVTLPDLGVYGLLLQLNDPHELVRFADHTLDALRRYDERKNAQLVSTVRTYLEQGMNVGRTAAALFVHQNTIGLRLKKVEEVAGLSLQQPESWLQLKLALMAADVLGGAETTQA